MLRYLSIVALFSLMLAIGSPQQAAAAAPLNVSVQGNVLTADLQVPGGYSTKLTVTFENVVGLSADSLNVSAAAINPLDINLLARLGNVVSGIPAGFPMLVSIEPDPSRGLSFSGVVNIELYTHDLEFVAASPLRLFSAPHGGAFEDITVMHGAGSYRSGGTKGNFSEFIIAVDSRTPLAAAGDKLQRLRSLLDGFSTHMDADIYNQLSGLVSAAESAYASNSLVASVTYVEAFADAVENHGNAIPNVWSASHSLENIAGRLRASAGTLRFSLTLAINNL
ncbi:MAG: hypothetical protein KJO95_10620 [Gammaproteobacteria bacterium]|nr:hypothetical protein [Gammaproteobacteria bacterium]MBU2676245.1 hypothetical protein [Gammaproteobacteria bacterium]NNC56647.1 hypothetical protein [Woeseiaceae bacterium]NNL49980.1 hypothetical protein [Woeseiaceae bacterium]